MSRGDVRGECPRCSKPLVETTSGTQVTCESYECSYYERLTDGERVELSVRRKK